MQRVDRRTGSRQLGTQRLAAGLLGQHVGTLQRGPGLRGQAGQSLGVQARQLTTQRVGLGGELGPPLVQLDEVT